MDGKVKHIIEFKERVSEIDSYLERNLTAFQMETVKRELLKVVSQVNSLMDFKYNVLCERAQIQSKFYTSKVKLKNLVDFSHSLCDCGIHFFERTEFIKQYREKVEEVKNKGYGVISMNSDLTISVGNMEASPLSKNMTCQFSKAFCKVEDKLRGRVGVTEANYLANEVLRGRLDMENSDEVQKHLDYIGMFQNKGMNFFEIVVLRSIYCELEEILNYSKKGMSLEEILQDLGLDDPDVEAVWGITEKRPHNWYLPYSAIKKTRCA